MGVNEVISFRPDHAEQFPERLEVSNEMKVASHGRYVDEIHVVNQWRIQQFQIRIV
jgi:hypothetical protein